MTVQVPRGDGSPVVELYSGIDSLYMSAKVAPPPFALISDLAQSRALALETGVAGRIDLGPASFDVAATGFGRYRFRLDHANGILGVTDSGSLPTFRIQPRASFLHGVGTVAAVNWWADVVKSVAANVRLLASRLDVCADFHGLDLRPEDRDFFLCPSGSRDEYTRDTFSGWVWGAPGAIQRARAYDKVADVKKKGADWVHALWGKRYEPGRSVWRVEAQCKREVLKEYGVDTAQSAIELAPRIYRSVFTKFLTLRVPTSDSNRSRWDLDPRWVAVAEPSFAFGAIGLDRVRDGRSSGEIRKLMPLLVGTMATAAASLNVGLIDVCGPALFGHVLAYGRMTGKSFDERVAERVARIERAS